MKKKIKIDPAVLILSVIVLSIVVIIIVASLFTGNKSCDPKTTTSSPEITFNEIPDVPSREEIKVNHSSKTMEAAYENNGIEYIYSSVVYPYFEGGNEDATAKINTAIQEFASERVTIKSYEKVNAEEAYNRAEQNGISFIQFEFVTRVESVYVKNGYLSVMFTRVKTVGMNEPSEDITTFCFDLISGNEVDISTFINIDADSARAFILDTFSQHININPGLYYNDALDTLPDVIDLKSFYLTEDGLVLYINPDIITPSVMGIRDFTVDYDKIGH